MKIDINSPPPLTFDRVMEGKPIAAHDSALFRIPTEILTVIVNYLSTDNEALASLALVNSDCRQLARSCQFRIVKFDFGPRSQSMLMILQREVVERRRNRGRCNFTPTLSACIRRVLVNNDGYSKEIDLAIPRKPGRSLEDTSGDAYDRDEEKLQQWRVTAHEIGRSLDEIYTPKLLFVLSGLVHLESLKMSYVDWNQSFLNNLTISNMRHLTLQRVNLGDIIPVMEDSVAIPLESLNIQLSWGFDFSYDYKGPNLNASKSWNTILRLFSASLKVLILLHRASACKTINGEHAISFSLQFPQLQMLDLHEESNFDQSALRSLILTSPHLSTLVVHYGHQATRELLDREGQISSLETLVLSNWIQDIPDDPGLNIPDDSGLDFLKKNPQLTAFGFHRPETSTVLDHSLSILTAFSQLRKLSMIWKGVHIPDSSLNALANLSSLEILHLSSGFSFGWRHDWFVSHEIIISVLRPLKRLIQIAFTRDVYSYTDEGQPTEVSYFQLRHDSWDLHRQSMHAWSLAYAKAFPNLEFIHVGKLSFEISRVRNEIELKTTEDEWFSWMSAMFGFPAVD